MVDDKNKSADPTEGKIPSDEVTLDINTFDDEDIFDQGPADPVDDVTMIENDDIVEPELEVTAEEQHLGLEQDLFDLNQGTDLFENNNNRLDDETLFANMFDSDQDEDIFGKIDAPSSAQPREETQENAFDVEDTTFSSDAFDDINADFPDSEQSIDLGDDQLFDYDATTSDKQDIESDDDIFSAPKGPDLKRGQGSGLSGKLDAMVGNIKGLFQGNKPQAATPADPGVKAKRIVRTAALLILVVLVYSLLRFINPSVDSTVAAEDSMAEGDKIAAFNLEKATPIAKEDVVATTEVEISAPVDPLEKVEVAVAEPAAPATPAVPAAPMAAVSEPVAPMAPAPLAVPSQAQLSAEQKVAELEAALASMNQKLAALNTQTQSSPLAPVTLNDMGTDDASALATKQVLNQALQRIDELDKKLLLLAELQKEMKSLSSQVQTLKTDVVQQSMIVGQTQREINTGVQSFRLDNPEPVRIMVQAAIPGRAWLRSETGELYTVIPGDEVPGYGKVVTIDAGTGTVIMSSRAVIREQF